MAMIPWKSRLHWRLTAVLGSLFAMLAPARPLFAGQIDITAKAIKSTLLVGEPLVLSVNVRADVPVVVPTDLISADLPFRVLIDRGSGCVPYLEYVLTPAPEHDGAWRVPAGITRELLLGYDAATLDWTFPAPGTYRLLVQYQQPDGIPVRSNVVTVTVQAPTGADEEVLVSLRQIGPQLVVPHEARLPATGARRTAGNDDCSRPVMVSDDTDPNPAITLASITCDDSCNVVQDIAEAALNTDDRSFELRAERSGAGTGRTYTITYATTDASGNSTTARTTVTVPHFQGQ